MEELIRKFNKNIELLAADHLMSRHFTDFSADIDKGEIARRVVLIDSLWQTQLRMDVGVTDAIVNAVSRNARELSEQLSNLRQMTLRENAGDIRSMARNIFPVVLQLDGHDRHLSFASKFFHWHAREQLPIYDLRRVPEGIRRFGFPEKKLINRVRNQNGDPMDKYSALIDICSAWLNRKNIDYEKLARVDFQTQHKISCSLAIQNTALRILDKCFYIRGREAPDVELA